MKKLRLFKPCHFSVFFIVKRKDTVNTFCDKLLIRFPIKVSETFLCIAEIRKMCMKKFLGQIPVFYRNTSLKHPINGSLRLSQHEHSADFEFLKVQSLRYQCLRYQELTVYG